MKERLLGKCVSWLCRIWGFTYRLKVNDLAGVTDKQRDFPVVFVVWHNRLFASIPLWKKTCGHYPVVALMSASRDGTVLEAAVSSVGVEVARGSSSRRGAAALILLRKALRAKKDAYITPDGPRGPVYELQPGVLKLALAEKIPIVSIGMKMHSYWELKSWDKFRIPKPFSRIELNYDAPVSMDQPLNEEEFEALRLKIQEQMSKTN